MGVSTNPWGSLPFPSSLPFPFSLPPLPLSPFFFPEAGGVVQKLGGINPLGNSLLANAVDNTDDVQYSYFASSSGDLW